MGMTDFRLRLDRFLSSRGLSPEAVSLTSDASTREYFRIHWQDERAVACVYPEAFVAGDQTFLDVSGLFRSNGLPVAEIMDYDEALGVIVQEDLGDTILRDVLAASDAAEKETLLNAAISLIARIQKATASAYDSGSIASRLKFDTDKLMWELDFFTEHYFRSFRKVDLHNSVSSSLRVEFLELCEELDSRARVLCHRDFHAANLMIDTDGELRIIDHQDARIGTTAYDLVSLLLDRITEPPSADWLARKRAFFIEERAVLGLERLDEADFAHEFRLQTIQRCLKAVGTFSYQAVYRDKGYFVPFIVPMFLIALRAIENLDRFPVLRQVMLENIDS